MEYGVWTASYAASVGERTAGDSRPYLRDGVARWKRLAVGGWEHREATRAARGAAPTCEGGAVEGARGHGDVGTWGVSEDRRISGPI